MSQTLKGSNLSIGNTISIKIYRNEDTPATEVFGQVTGLRLWNPDTIAVEISGISDWIRLTDNTEVGLA